MNVVFLGPPGAGKGTQARKVSAALGIRHLSTGDLLRSAISAGSELGRQAQVYMDRGNLVPDQVVSDLLEVELASDACGSGFLLDGYPRNVLQAERLTETEGRLGRAIDAVLVLLVPDAAIRERLSGRRSCPKPGCGAMYHVKYSPPRVAGQCDACGTTLVTRKDDRPEVIEERLAVYHEETKPLLDYYERRGLVRRIDGTVPIAEVQGAVLSALGVGP